MSGLTTLLRTFVTVLAIAGGMMFAISASEGQRMAAVQVGTSTPG